MAAVDNRHMELQSASDYCKVLFRALQSAPKCSKVLQSKILWNMNVPKRFRESECSRVLKSAPKCSSSKALPSSVLECSKKVLQPKALLSILECSKQGAPTPNTIPKCFGVLQRELYLSKVLQSDSECSRVL